MHGVAIVIAVVWAAFWIYWLAAAAGGGVKPGRTRWAQFAGVRVVLLIIALVLVRAKAFKHNTITSNPLLEGIGLAVFLLGLGLAVWARLYIGRNWGMPMTEKDNPDLVTTGPYRTVRHPIYSGIILGMVGTAVAVSFYWLIAVVLIGGYFTYSALMEERYMAGQFPETYPAYKRSTKMLIPFLF